MPPVDFIPRHAQPFTLEQAMQLEISVLVTEITRLENSITHLLETQQELTTFLTEDPDGDEDGEITKAKDENDEVIASQRERIALIKVALMNKVGEGGLRHYGLNKEDEVGTTSTRVIDTDHPSSHNNNDTLLSGRPANTTSDPTHLSAATADDDDGMHL